MFLFYRHIAKHIAERKALGKHANIKSLLEERLKMDSNSVEQLLAMYPRLAKCKPSRVRSFNIKKKFVFLRTRGNILLKYKIYFRSTQFWIIYMRIRIIQPSK